MSEIKTFQAGDIIFSEHELSNEVYLIKSGCVRIYQTQKGKEVMIASFFSGDIFGEMSFFLDNVRTATARAQETSEIYVISKDLLKDNVEKSTVWFKSIIKIMMKRLQETTINLNEIKGNPPLKYLNNYVKDNTQSEKALEEIAKDWEQYINQPECLHLRTIFHKMAQSRKGPQRTIVETALVQINEYIAEQLRTGKTAAVAEELNQMLSKPEYVTIKQILKNT